MVHIPGSHYAGRLASTWLLTEFHPWLCPSQRPVSPQVLQQQFFVGALWSSCCWADQLAEGEEADQLARKSKSTAPPALEVEVQPTTALQAPPPLPTTPSLPPKIYRYRLAPGDQLVTSVFKIEGYEAQVQVLSDGTINLPRLGTVEVWGLTLEEARQRITAGYSQFLRRPLVYLDLVEQRPVRVTVTGQVLRPGVFTLPVNSEGILWFDERSL